MTVTTTPEPHTLLTHPDAPGQDSWSSGFLDHLHADAASVDPAEGLASPSPLAALRSDDLRRLGALPFPSRRQEDWRFTDLSPLRRVSPQRLLSPSPAAQPPVDEGAFRLRLDGRGDLLAADGLPAGIEPLSTADQFSLLGAAVEATGCRDVWPVVLNGAAATRILALRVKGAVVPTLELVSDAGDAEGVLPVRILLLLEAGASLNLLQVHLASGANLTSVVVEAHVRAGARLRHALVARGGDRSVLLAHLAVRQEPSSDVSQTSVMAGWGVGRLEPRLVQSHGGACTRLRGLQLARDHQLVDTHSHVDFGGPEGRLDQLHKAVVDDAARSVFNGAVTVPRQAQRTQAAQLSRNLLLSDRARIDTKPQLEIVADDVKCAHGATVSRLEQDELFYLQSRGIASDQAARLLLRGFCQEVLEELPACAHPWSPLGSWFHQETPDR